MEVLVHAHSEALASNKSKLVMSSLEPPHTTEVYEFLSLLLEHAEGSSSVFIMAHIHPLSVRVREGSQDVSL